MGKRLAVEFSWKVVIRRSKVQVLPQSRLVKMRNWSVLLACFLAKANQNFKVRVPVPPVATGAEVRKSPPPGAFTSKCRMRTDLEPVCAAAEVLSQPMLSPLSSTVHCRLGRTFSRVQLGEATAGGVDG